MATEPEEFEDPEGSEEPDDVTGDPEVNWDVQPLKQPLWVLTGVVVDPRDSDITDPTDPVDPPVDPPVEPPVEPPVDPIDAPAAPSNLVAVGGDGLVDLTWVRNSTDENSFRVERSLTTGTGFAPIATVGAGVLSYSDTALAAGTQFFYLVYAVNSGGDSLASNEANATTDAAAVPADPTGLTAETTAPGVVDLAWTDVAVNEDDYRVERSISPTAGFAEIATLAADSITYKDEAALPPEQQFYYRVRASNAAGFSGYTNVASGGGLFYPNGFANRYPIKVRANQVTEVLDNYHIRLEIQADFLKLESVDPINGKMRNASGFDLSFEELDGTKMAYDRRAQDTTAGTIEVWIYTSKLFAEHAFYVFVGNDTITTDQQDKVAMWANVATMALDCLNGVDFAGKQTVTVVSPASADTLLGEAGSGDGTATFTVPMDTLFAGDTEQSSMCWVRAASVGNDEGWVESLAPGAYPSGGNTFAAWLQRYDSVGALGGSTNNVKYGVDGESFETSSNRQTLDNQHFAMTWRGGQYPSLYIDGGSPEFRDAATGLPGAALGGDPGDVLEFYNGFDTDIWQGVFDEYIQYDRELSGAFVNTSFKNQTSTTNFLFVGAEGVVPEPGYVPDPGEPPTPQPETDWDTFFLNRTLPTIPAADTTANVSTWAALNSAIAAAAANTGNVGRVNLTADLNNIGAKDVTYIIQPNTTVIVDFQGNEINNSDNGRVSMRYDGLVSDWNTGGDNSRVTQCQVIQGKMVATFLNPISGWGVGDWIKLFTPMIDETRDWRLGSLLWARSPHRVRIGQTLQVENINGNVVTFTDTVADPIQQFPETAQSGRLWGVKYRSEGVNSQGSLFLIENKFRETTDLGNVSVLALVYTHHIRPYHECTAFHGGSYPVKLLLGGIRGKIYDGYWQTLPAGLNLGKIYTWMVGLGSCQNVACNTDGFSRAFNVDGFRHYGDSASSNLNTGLSDHDMARRAGSASFWGINKSSVGSVTGSSVVSTHSGSSKVRLKDITIHPTHPLPKLMGLRSFCGASFDTEIIEGFNLQSVKNVSDVLIQIYNESAESFYVTGTLGSPQVPAGSNSQGENNGSFGYLLRNNIIHWDSASFFYMSGGWRGPVKMGSGNEIHVKKTGVLLNFNPGSSQYKATSAVITDPRPGWEVRGGSTYHIYNSGSIMNTLKSGCQCNWGGPIIDLSKRTSGAPYTLVDVDSGCTLTGTALLLNPNNVPVTPATGAGNRSGFSVQTI